MRENVGRSNRRAAPLSLRTRDEVHLSEDLTTIKAGNNINRFGNRLERTEAKLVERSSNFKTLTDR